MRRQIVSFDLALGLGLVVVVAVAAGMLATHLTTPTGTRNRRP